jgi:hypothetical protein
LGGWHKMSPINISLNAFYGWQNSKEEELNFFIDAIPEIIASLVVASILAVIGRIYTLRRKKAVKKLFSSNAHSSNGKGGKSISPNITFPDKQQGELPDESSNKEIILPVGTNINELREYIITSLREVQSLIAKTETPALNWSPADVNSIFKLGTHVRWQSDEWICHFIGNMPIDRNRNNEFTAIAVPPIWAQGLKEELGEVIEKIEIVFDKLEESDLNDTIILHGKSKGVGTTLYCLVHVIEHTLSHLAEMKMIETLFKSQYSTKK